MEKQLELPFDAIRIESTQQLDTIRLSADEIRIHIADLLVLSDSLFIRGKDGLVTGSMNGEVHRRICALLVGRTVEMTTSQKKQFQLLTARLSIMFPAARRKALV